MPTGQRHPVPHATRPGEEHRAARRPPTAHAAPAPRAAADDREPVGTFPRRTRSRTAAGTRWEVLTSAGGVAVTTPGGLVAGARVETQGQRVVLEFWTSTAGLPQQLRRDLVGSAFGHPAVRPRTPVLVCAPTGDSEVLSAVRRHVAVTGSRVAGATCLVEGAVGG